MSQSHMLGLKGQHWLKAFHILFGGTWVAAGLSISLIGIFCAPGGIVDAHTLDMTRMFIDDWIVIPSALGCLLTSLLYSTLTAWGWFKHRFIVVKWVICIGGVLFGTFYLGPWLNSLPPVSAALGMAAFDDPEYVSARTLNFWGALAQNATLVAAVFISTLKPWGRRKQR